MKDDKGSSLSQKSTLPWVFIPSKLMHPLKNSVLLAPLMVYANIKGYQWALLIALFFSIFDASPLCRFSSCGVLYWQHQYVFTNLIWRSSYQSSQALLRLERNVFTVNPLKYEWAAQTTEYLGFLLTPDGIKHLPQKVQDITYIARPTSTKSVWSFVGLVNYYKYMWPRHAHFLTSLTDVYSTSKKFVLINAQEHAFHNIKQLLAEDVMIHFPNHKKSFDIYTDTRKYQIWASIKQEQLPIAHFSRKLTPTQRRYSTIEQDMLAIVEVLKECRNFLLGARIIIYWPKNYHG